MEEGKQHTRDPDYTQIQHQKERRLYKVNLKQPVNDTLQLTLFDAILLSWLDR